MLFGTYKHCLDTKQRLTLPVKLRIKLANPVYITKGLQADLEIRSKQEFLNWQATVLDSHLNDKELKDFQRLILANTLEIYIDNAGRIKIPKTFIQDSNLEKNVFILGLGDHLEVWSQSKYDQHKKQALSLVKKINYKLTRGDL
ncbi:division/cell wall cluster transcriptional repressor MraZ [Mycoplasma putrefaciens]|uniref:Transcriptional regulator MraZ n=1 Tax=Mycoplasma putrefaciens Mput9231 TaxID=1292033 RepID=M9WHM0_9MOLU|nr:division/cell wall cluster transcriptional repressor MraZ [Mycoplasma putrefaciens]AGJ90874.1 Protein MraZ [Mycoplasma putrefaciens Mput9231]